MTGVLHLCCMPCQTHQNCMCAQHTTKWVCEYTVTQFACCAPLALLPTVSLLNHMGTGLPQSQSQCQQCRLERSSREANCMCDITNSCPLQTEQHANALQQPTHSGIATAGPIIYVAIAAEPLCRCPPVLCPSVPAHSQLQASIKG